MSETRSQVYEIQKLQERIKQLEDARTVAAANSLANMISYEDAVAKIKQLEDRLKTAWKVISNLSGEKPARIDDQEESQ